MPPKTQAPSKTPLKSTTQSNSAGKGASKSVVVKTPPKPIARPAQKSKHGLIAAGLLVLSVGVIVAVWLLYGNPFENSRSVETPSYLTLQKDLRVNIDGGRNAAVVIGMTLELKNDKALDKAKENEAVMVEGMRRYFQDKKPEQLRGGENMKQVAEDLTGVVNDQIREKGMKTPVKSIWFNKYLIQD